ncbi:hypothetical protein PO903_04715 [Paenibacillus sp. PK4536]|uniref:hypothetical protein n=1 Tax=unclassified Paenibacillus TaxID=185978 RepID=UPI0010C00A2A|nr:MULTISPECIES: hypothetical protein [unclassified Paenibacillus]TKJ89864.1 hypothetical protein PaeCFBP13512_14700 [Paenibacillus sp. CFBP13512]WIM40198.1 hypothetical protein PO903_04715 [Paenibacillus sp. PK4536]
MSLLSAISPVTHAVSTSNTSVHVIHSIEVFQYDNRRLALPEMDGYLHCGLLKIASHGVTGWAEYSFTDQVQHLDLVKWSRVFTSLKKCPLDQALSHIDQQQQNWGSVRSQVALEALTELRIRLQDSPDVWTSSDALINHAFLLDYTIAYYSF